MPRKASYGKRDESRQRTNAKRRLSVGDAGVQGLSQIVDLAKVDVETLEAGYRASMIIGSDAVNDAGEIRDVLVSSDGKKPFAVLSIGGFLGMGTHAVVVPYETLRLVS